jgi:hypothetical protein
MSDQVNREVNGTSLANKPRNTQASSANKPMNNQDNLSLSVNNPNGTAIGSNADNVSGHLDYGNRLRCNATNTNQAKVGNNNRANNSNWNVTQSDNYVISVGEFLQIHVPNMRTYVFSCYKFPNFDLRT